MVARQEAQDIDCILLAWIASLLAILRGFACLN